MEKRLFLLDAFALIFRAYYALIKMPRISSGGFNTSAIFGFVNTLEEILGKQHPSHLAVCFDPQGPTFRDEAYAEYKGERDAMPEDIRLSIPIIKDIIRAYRIPIIEVEGYEADDVIGTMSRKAEKEGYTVFMMTPDKDFGQLVTENVLQYKPSYRGQDFELRGVREVCDRYSLERPSQVIDLLALMGDKIDNIPGCPGIGEVTAVKLLKEFGDIDSLLKNTDKLKGALKKKVEDNAKLIEFSRFLATIRTDVPVTQTPEDLKLQTPDKDALFEIFRKLEFRSLLQRVDKRLGGETAKPAKGTVMQGSLFDFGDEIAEEVSELPKYDDSQSQYRVADNAGELSAMQTALASQDRCGLFMVYTGEGDVDSKVYGAAIAAGNGKAWFIPATFTEGMAAVEDLCGRDDICKVTPQAKRDYVVIRQLRRDNDDPLRNYWDISLAHYLLQPDMRHGLDNIADAYLHFLLPVYDSIAGKGAKQLSPDKLPADVLTRWACQRADICLQLRPLLETDLEKEDLLTLLDDIELPLVRVLGDMELTGVRIDVDALREAAQGLETRMGELEKEIYSLAGEAFNIGSPAKVGEILFERLKLSNKAKKTKNGQYSTSEDVLEKLAEKHPIARLILEYRQLKKLLNTYLTALPESINPVTGKIHTTYNQTVTATGRISSSNPNLQNIPVRDEIGRDIRKAFIADPGHLFLSADYSQIELRLVADFADEDTMVDAFAHDTDVHAVTASRIYHKPLEQVTANERRNAKTANFGILYGITSFGLATRLNIPKSEAKELIDNYFKSFPKLHKYISDSVEEAREHGYTLTRLGRKRRLPDINSKNPVVRGYAERNAVNAPIQGTAADIIKIAMVRIAAEMLQRGLKSRMIMQVHDELNFDVVADELPVMQELVCRNMQDAWKGKVPLTASCGVASNWLDAH